MCIRDRKKFYTAIVLNVHYCAPTEYEVKDISALLDACLLYTSVFYQLVKAVSNTLNPIEQVTSWLYRVTRNTIINKGKMCIRDST